MTDRVTLTRAEILARPLCRIALRNARCGIVESETLACGHLVALAEPYPAQAIYATGKRRRCPHCPPRDS